MPCIGNLKFGEMEFGEMKRNTSNWSNFGMLSRRTGLSASAGLSCLKLHVIREDMKETVIGCFFLNTLYMDEDYPAGPVLL